MSSSSSAFTPICLCTNLYISNLLGRFSLPYTVDRSIAKLRVLWTFSTEERCCTNFLSGGPLLLIFKQTSSPSYQVSCCCCRSLWVPGWIFLGTSAVLFKYNSWFQIYFSQCLLLYSVQNVKLDIEFILQV